jgi:hypothetical protein
MDNNHRGVSAELTVGAYFADCGFEVFYGFGGTSCDLIVLRDGATHRVEVKRAGYTRNHTGDGGRLVCQVLVDAFDWLVVVDPDGQVVTDLDRLTTAVRGRPHPPWFESSVERTLENLG